MSGEETTMDTTDIADAATGAATGDLDALRRHLNQGDMAIIAHLTTLDARTRTAAALALRGRGPSDARRFSHAADLALRIPEIYLAVAMTGQIAVDHLALVWSRINRQLVHVVADRADELRGQLDTAVAEQVTPWITAASERGPVDLVALQAAVDAALIDAAPALIAATIDVERDTAALRRRGTDFILTTGSEVTSGTVDAALDKKVDTRLAGLRRDRRDAVERGEADGPGDFPALPTRAQIKAQILLELLGDDPETIHVRVSLYRATTDGVHGTGAGWIAETGWIDPGTADRLESAAETVHTVPTDPADLKTSKSYRFPLIHQLHIEARDGTCRFPGCTEPASRCEKDHIVNSPHTDPDSDGPTHVSNGMSLCRAHHREKSAGRWRADTPDGGYTVHWTAPDGQEYTTRAAGPIGQHHRERESGPDEGTGNGPAPP
jgi:hypothetical protein